MDRCPAGLERRANFRRSHAGENEVQVPVCFLCPAGQMQEEIFEAPVFFDARFNNFEKTDPLRHLGQVSMMISGAALCYS